MTKSDGNVTYTNPGRVSRIGVFVCLFSLAIIIFSILLFLGGVPPSLLERGDRDYAEAKGNLCPLLLFTLLGSVFLIVGIKMLLRRNALRLILSTDKFVWGQEVSYGEIREVRFDPAERELRIHTLGHKYIAIPEWFLGQELKSAEEFLTSKIYSQVRGQTK